MLTRLGAATGLYKGDVNQHSGRSPNVLSSLSSRRLTAPGDLLRRIDDQCSLLILIDLRDTPSELLGDSTQLPSQSLDQPGVLIWDQVADLSRELSFWEHMAAVSMNH